MAAALSFASILERPYEKVPFTKHGFSYYEPGQVRELLKKAGFGSIEMVSGSSRLGEFVCAVATK